ncbi:MAG: type II toxin-antitoxin system VapC family toxin [Phycisphaerae bacterium]
MMLVDTSVWVHHFRYGSSELVALLEVGVVASHPFVIGELACGTMKNRSEVLALLARLPGVEVATHAEVLSMIERQELMGRGIGWVDMHLLASSMLSRVVLLTKDRRLREVATELGLAADR